MICNKPKEIQVKLFGGKMAYIRKDCIDIDNGKYTSTIMPSDLEDMLHAYQSL